MVSHSRRLAEVCGPHIPESAGRLAALLGSPPFRPAKPLWDGQDIQPRPVGAESAEEGAGVEDHMFPKIGQAHAAPTQGSKPPLPALADTSAASSLAASHCASPAAQPAPAGGPLTSDAAGGSSSAATASDSTACAAELAHNKHVEQKLKELKLKRLKLQLAQMQMVGVSASRNGHDSLT